MAKYISMIISKNHPSPLYLTGEDDHEMIKKHYNLNNSYSDKSSIMKVTVRPLKSIVSKIPDEWELIFHEYSPQWFNNTSSSLQWEQVCKEEIVSVIVPELIRNNYVFEGDMDLSNTMISELPEKLKVDGDLNIRSTKIKKLPVKLKISGDLYIDENQLSIQPLAFSIGGEICPPLI